MASAYDLICGALRLIGQLAEGEQPSIETANDALVAFNQMIESWNTERLAVFTTQDQTFTWPASTASRTLGPTGNFVGTRPILIDDSTYFKVNNLSYTLQFINQLQYDGIALKGNTSTYPQFMYVNMGYPDLTMYVYPVPTSALEMHIISVEELSQPATLATDLAFPPGYLRAFRFCLACEIAAEFGVEPSPQVQRIAMTSKRDLKRVNNPGDVMAMPFSLVANRRWPTFNIFSGQG